MINNYNINNIMKEWLDTEGPWKGEPQGNDFICFSYKEYDYWVFRNQILGNWNGYIQIPENALTQDEIDDLDVHGGITYSGTADETAKEGHIVIGFDTAHIGKDILPFSCFFYNKVSAEIHNMACMICEAKKNNEKSEFYKNWMEEGTYKTFEWTKEECKRIIDQIILKLKEK